MNVGLISLNGLLWGKIIVFDIVWGNDIWLKLLIFNFIKIKKI